MKRLDKKLKVVEFKIDISDDSIIREVKDQLYFDSIQLGINHEELFAEYLKEIFMLETGRLCIV